MSLRVNRAALPPFSHVRFASHRVENGDRNFARKTGLARGRLGPVGNVSNRPEII
jgi:hypothetical protein